MTRGSYDTCILESKKALNLDSTLSYVHFNLALGYLLKGENEIAKAEYTGAINRAKRFGIPKRNFERAIDDLITYMSKVSHTSIGKAIIRMIKDTANIYADTTTVILHVDKTVDLSDSIYDYRRKSLHGIRVSTIDVFGNTIWTSDKVTDFIDDSSQYLIKLEIPQIILLRSKKTNCLYLYSTLVKKGGSEQSFETKYSSENKPGEFSNIKLNLTSTPKGAEVFLIPNRIWLKEFDGKQWQSYSDNFMDKFRLNGTATNTFTDIDETVFVILFNSKDNIG